MQLLKEIAQLKVDNQLVWTEKEVLQKQVAAQKLRYENLKATPGYTDAQAAERALQKSKQGGEGMGRHALSNWGR